MSQVQLFPETTKELEGGRLCFAHLDGDACETTGAARAGYPSHPALTAANLIPRRLTDP